VLADPLKIVFAEWTFRRGRVMQGLAQLADGLVNGRISRTLAGKAGGFSGPSLGQTDQETVLKIAWWKHSHKDGLSSTLELIQRIAWHGSFRGIRDATRQDGERGRRHSKPVRHDGGRPHPATHGPRHA